MKKKPRVILIVAVLVIVVVLAVFWVGRDIFAKIMQPIEKPILYIYPEQDTEISIMFGTQMRSPAHIPITMGFGQ